MSVRNVTRTLPFVLILVLTRHVLAITSFDKEFVCPICKTKNVFRVYASWGSYVYQWPSKFQLVFWPHTYGESLYSCKKCHLTAFLEEFTDVPKDKLVDLRDGLSGVHLTKDYAKYTDIPMSERLPIAEKVYRVLGKDDFFWCHFYRVEGYHFDLENKAKEAADARGKALELAHKLAADPKNAGHLKELLVISGAMKHFLGRDPEAIADLEAAARLKFGDDSWPKENAQGYDGYLSQLIKDYIRGIQQGDLPKPSAE